MVAGLVAVAVLAPAWALADDGEVQRLTASDPSGHASFGQEVDATGEWMIVGAPGDDAAYMFKRDGAVWTETQKLVASDAPGLGFSIDFGIAVAVDTNFAAVAAFNRVYVFQRTGDDWTEEQIIPIAGELPDVDISGALMVVGTTFMEDETRYRTLLYRRAGGVWTYSREFASYKYAAGGIGHAVGIDGTTVVSTGPSLSPPEVMIFERQGGVWGGAGTFVATDCCLAEHLFGRDVVMDGTTRAMVASTEEAWLLEKESNGSWSRTSLVPGGLQSFNRNIRSAAVGDDVAMVLAGPGGGDSFGYQFNLIDGAWTETRRFGASDGVRLENASAFAGDQVALGGHRATADGQSFAGAVYVFDTALLCGGLEATIVGTPGPDVIDGVPGQADVVLGLGGNDVLRGGDQDDTLCGGPGNDTLIGGDGDDTLLGGAGSDTVNYAGLPQGVAVDLFAGTASGQGNDSLEGIENAVGTNHADRLSGNGQRNRLIGWGGPDVLLGFGGVDHLDGGGGNDTLDGGGGNDVILGGYGNDWIKHRYVGDRDDVDGGSGVDTITYAGSPRGVTIKLDGSQATDRVNGVENATGTSWADTIWGTNARNVLKGGFGTDTINPLAGNDSVMGGSGRDTIAYRTSNAAVTVDLEDGLATGSGADRFWSIENVEGSRFGDFLFGDAGDNRLVGFAGGDTILGSVGNDRLVGGGGGDVLFGDAGDDELLGGDHDDRLFGGSGNDALDGQRGDDELHGESGDDDLVGGSGVDAVSFEWSSGPVHVDLAAGSATGDGSDSISQVEDVIGSPANDVIRGDANDNFLNGIEGDDLLVGGGGDDLLLGLDGDDTLRGQAGDDQIVGNAGEDRLEGGSGFDFADFFSSPAGVVVDLRNGTATGDGPDTLVGMEGIFGSKHADHLHGNTADNVILGLEGDDFLFGYGGDDYLDGGLGFDTIAAGFGDDFCVGGESTVGCEQSLDLLMALDLGSVPQSAAVVRFSSDLFLL